MRKNTLTVVFGLVLVLVAQSFAHRPEGELFFAVQFPDEAVPTIDGDLSDWAIVPTNPYTILNDKLYDSYSQVNAERGEIDAANMNIRHQLGWNETANQIYLATQVFDNVHNTDRADPGKFFQDDAIEIEVNANHKDREEQNQEFADGHSYKFAVPPIQESYFFYRPVAGLTWIFPGSEWLDFAYSFEGDEFGESTYFYEVAITPIDTHPLDEATALDGVQIFDLEEGETIHFSVNILDMDAGDAWADAGFWTVSPTECCYAETDFVLTEMDPALEANIATSVKSDTWGRIKSQF